MVRLDTDRVYVTEIDDQAVVLDAVSSTYLTANGTGALILDDLRVETTVDALVASVADGFDVDLEVARRDCLAFLDDLRRRGWLTGREEDLPDLVGS